MSLIRDRKWRNSSKNVNENWKTDTRVTDEQVAFYNENGYLKYGRIFTQGELDELRDYVDDMIASHSPTANARNRWTCHTSSIPTCSNTSQTRVSLM